MSHYGSANSEEGTERVGAVFKFTETTFTSRVGISFISTSKACQHVDAQIPAGTTLASLVRTAKDNWNTQVLSKMETSEVHPVLSCWFHQMLIEFPDGCNYASVVLLFALWHAYYSVESYG